MARDWGKTEEEKNMLEFNARNLVTLWGPRGEIADYASKQWNGLLADYYLPRWQKFFQHVGMTLREGKPLNQHSFLEKLLVFEQDWQTKIAGADLPTAPVGEALDIVQVSARERERGWGSEAGVGASRRGGIRVGKSAYVFGGVLLRSVGLLIGRCCLKQGAVVLNRALLCQTGRCCVEKGVVVLNRALLC